jgi:glycerol-3-phosphate O-acyltransferase
MLASPGPPIGIQAVRDRVLWLSRLFKFEFTFRADAPFERIFDDEIAALQTEGELVRIAPRHGESAWSIAPNGADGREQFTLYARIIENSLEGYRLAARALTTLLRGSLPMKDVVKRTITLGERMFLAGEIGRREAVSRPIVENAFASFVDQGYIEKLDGKYSLTSSYATPSVVATIESRIAAMTSVRAQP